MPRIIVGFTQFGVPQTGLSATVDIRRVSDSASIVAAGAMSHVGEGNYQYDFDAGAGFVEGVDYSFRSDGGVALPNSERYVFGASSLTPENTAAEVWNALQSAHTTPGSFGAQIQKLLGLVGENQVIAVLTKNVNGDALTQRIRHYNTLANAATDNGVTGLLDTYDVVATYDGNNSLDSFLITRVGS